MNATKSLNWKIKLIDSPRNKKNKKIENMTKKAYMSKT